MKLYEGCDFCDDQVFKMTAAKGYNLMQDPVHMWEDIFFKNIHVIDMSFIKLRLKDKTIKMIKTVQEKMYGWY